MRSLALLISLCLLAAPTALAEEPKLAMTALQCDPAEVCTGAGARQRRDLQDQLEAAVLRVVRRHLGIVTPDAVLRELTMGGMSRAEAEQTCIEASCAVDIGGALGAQYIMQSMLYRLGNRYKLTAKVWRVEDNTSASSGSVYAKSIEAMSGELAALARQTCAPLVTRSRRQRSDLVDVADDVDGSPQISSGDVTDALGGLAAVGRPSSARVRLLGASGEFSLRIGDTRDGLPLGRYRWTASAEGYADATGSVEVTPDGVTPIVVKLDKLATLEIHGEPRGAEVTVVGPDGKRRKVGLGTTLRDILPGNYMVTVGRGGYEPHQRRLKVRPGAKEQMKVKLERLGGLTVEGSPRGAKVLVVARSHRFRHEGGLPWSAKGIKSGFYNVTVSRNGYDGQRRTVKVMAGKQTTLRVDLEKSHPSAREYAAKRRAADQRREAERFRRREANLARLNRQGTSSPPKSKPLIPTEIVRPGLSASLGYHGLFASVSGLEDQTDPTLGLLEMSKFNSNGSHFVSAFGINFDMGRWLRIGFWGGDMPGQLGTSSSMLGIDLGVTPVFRIKGLPVFVPISFGLNALSGTVPINSVFYTGSLDAMFTGFQTSVAAELSTSRASGIFISVGAGLRYANLSKYSLTEKKGTDSEGRAITETHFTKSGDFGGAMGPFIYLHIGPGGNLGSQ